MCTAVSIHILVCFWCTQRVLLKAKQGATQNGYFWEWQVYPPLQFCSQWFHPVQTWILMVVINEVGFLWVTCSRCYTSSVRVWNADLCCIVNIINLYDFWLVLCKMHCRYALPMCVCSVEIFTPLYTSRVIQGIAIEKSEATFVNAIIWMGILSAARWHILSLPAF